MIQPDLFANHERPEQYPLPDPADIRRRLHKMLADARGAEDGISPWPYKKAGLYKIIFPQMANWLPEDEANQLRLEFATEIERFDLAA